DPRRRAVTEHGPEAKNTARGAPAQPSFRGYFSRFPIRPAEWRKAPEAPRALPWRAGVPGPDGPPRIPSGPGSRFRAPVGTLIQKLQHFPRERLGRLDIDDVRALEDHAARVRNAVDDDPGLGGRRALIVRTGNDENRRLDLLHALAQI